MILRLPILINTIIFKLKNKFSSNKKTTSKSLLLIRLDGIGDYILFRKYMEILRQSKKYLNYNITLLGNILWKDLSEELDSNYIDNFIWLDRIKFKSSFFYQYKILNLITSVNYEVVISPVYSRSFFQTDMIVNLVKANEKIGNSGDLSLIKKWQKKISDRFYNRLIPAKNEIMFEFYRNKEFFEGLLENKINLNNKYYFKLKQNKPTFKLPCNYAILFIGGGKSYRKWNTINFAKIGKYLKDHFNYNIVLCGGPTDIEEATVFKSYYQDKYLDLTGKTTLVELLYVISKGSIMIANETSAPHLAISLKMPNVFVISNGNHYGRFTPYPKEIAPNYHPIYHPEIENDLVNYNILRNLYGYGSHLDINEISFEMVKNKIDQVLNK